ncbi:MAG: hypothetical protein HLUCCA12_12005 [Rhodobacteraceae bacterium HLUCCA12]|nr:MAG: hypothetical protein HLUCCA12_12005 [Rhodobacteraceae bacterium HLUCCA12]
MILTCLKTGRWWRCRDHAHADRLARLKGVVDYEVFHG